MKNWRDHDGTCAVREVGFPSPCTCEVFVSVPVMPKEVTFTSQGLQFARDVARRYWLETDAKVNLPGAPKTISETDLVALSWVVGVAALLDRDHLGETYITPKLDIPSSEQAASDH